MCCDAPSPPDMSAPAAATTEAAQLAKQSADQDLAFRKQVYQDNLPRLQQLYDLSNQVSQQQLGIAGQNQDRANEQWDYWKQAYQPMEQAMNMDAYQGQYLTPQELAAMKADPSQSYQLGKTAADRKAQEDVAGLQGLQDQQLGYLQQQRGLDRERVSADVNNAYSQQARNLTRMGGDPNRMMAMAGQIANQQSLARVSGLNQINQGYAGLQQQVKQNYGGQIQQTQANRYNAGTSLRAGAASFGRNMPNTAGQAYGLATQAGNSAVANQNTGTMSGLPFAQFQAGGYGAGQAAAGLQQQGALGLANAQNNAYATQAGVYGSQMQGLGSLVGTGAGLYMFSDRRLKSDVVFIGKHRKHDIGVYEYTLFGRRERGVMADEVEKVLPHAVKTHESGYKLVNYAELE